MGNVAAAPVVPLSRSVDAIRESIEALERFLPPPARTPVIVESIEDDIREGLDAAAQVEAHFAELIDVVTSDRPSPIRLLEASEDHRVLRLLERLTVLSTQLRKQVSRTAGQIHGEAG
jgi:hypothetical protein